jgi:hypothetical protein
MYLRQWQVSDHFWGLAIILSNIWGEIMQRQICVLPLFVAVVFIFSACGPVTPVPSEMPMVSAAPPTITPLLQATATPSIMPTPEPTPSVRLWDQLPPSQPVDRYELAPWDKNLSGKLDDILYTAASEYHPYSELRNAFQAAFTAEAWLRAPLSDDKKSLLCQVTYFDPGDTSFPNLRPGQDLFAFFVEEMINSEGIAVEKLPEEFGNRFGLGCLGGFSLNAVGNIDFEPSYVKNLFGDGQNAYVFVVGTVFDDKNRVAVYVVHSVEGIFQVEKVRDWEAYSSAASVRHFRLFDVGDLNGNGRNELVVELNYGGSGFPTREAEWVYWYEWDNDFKGFKGGQEIKVFGQSCNDRPCYGDWKFSRTIIHSAISVTTQELLYTNLDKCEYLTRERIYLFTEENLVLQSTKLLFPDNREAACEISWAYETLIQPDGWKNDRAIQILSNAMNNWPPEMNSAWDGPAAQDYFRLMLAVWRDFRGEKEAAVALLEPLLPPNRNSEFIPELAQAYFATHQTGGVLAACSEMDAVQRKLLDDKYGETATRFIGFGSQRWWTSVDDFCDENTAVSSASEWSQAEFGEITDSGKLQDWLTRQGKTNVFVKKLTVGQGEVWLASFLARKISQYDMDVYQLWAFTKTPQRLEAIFLREMRLDQIRENVTERYNENSISAQLFLSESNIPIALVEFDQCVNFLKVSASGKLDPLGEECGTDLYVWPHADQVGVLRNKHVYPREWETISYKWNAITQTFDKVQNPSFDFLEAQREAERLIYAERNYVGAIVYINKVLLKAPPEQVFSPLCYDNIAQNYDAIKKDPSVANCDLPPEWYRPYLRYLLGIAHEMAGQPEMAKLTFYALWNEYPTHLFGVAASQRLAPVLP